MCGVPPPPNFQTSYQFSCQSQPNLYLRGWHSQLSLFYISLNKNPETEHEMVLSRTMQVPLGKTEFFIPLFQYSNFQECLFQKKIIFQKYLKKYIQNVGAKKVSRYTIFNFISPLCHCPIAKYPNTQETYSKQLVLKRIYFQKKKDSEKKFFKFDVFFWLFFRLSSFFR